MSVSNMQLVGSEPYFRQLCEHVGVALIGADRDLKIQVWNAAAGRMFGAAADRMTGTDIVSIVPQIRRRTVERMLRRALDDGEITDIEFEHRDEHGRRRELAGTIAPIVSETGERVGVTICLRDLTRYVARQAERFESRKLSALGEMAGMIAHHFNNIVGGVITSIDFAGDSDDPAIARRVLRQTSEALSRATSLIHGLLVFAEGDQQAGDLGDLTEIINDAADTAEQMIAGRSIKLVINVPNLPVLPIPRVQMLTVLHNLTRNAIDAMPEGGVLTISAAAKVHKIVIEVRDTGIGLDESAIPRIFEPFWSTKAGIGAPTASAKGLGLAVAHGLVRVMGGSIQVHSEPNKGSRFRISIPRPTSKQP